MSESIEPLRGLTLGSASKQEHKTWYGDFGPVVLYQGQALTFVSFGAFVGLGTILGILHTWFYLGGYQMLPEQAHSYQLALALALGAPLSAYIITRLLDMHSWLSGEKTFLEYIGTVSFGLWGGLLGGLSILAAFALTTGTPLLFLLDAFAVGVPLAQAFGRLGCLNYGCCHGRECHSNWLPGIRYHHHQTKVLRYDPKLKGKRLHPTQIYSVMANLLIYSLLLTLWISWDARPAGALSGLFFTLYGLKRFLVEFLRGEFPRIYWLGLTVWQWFSLLFLFGGIMLLSQVIGVDTRVGMFEFGNGIDTVRSSFWLLAGASIIVSLAYGVHGKKIGSWR